MRRGAESALAATVADTARPWWEQRGVIAALVLAAAIPLLYPPIPPLVDLFGHMGRYRVELDLGHSPWLQHYYDYHWEAIGNLGVDLLVAPLARLIGLEPAVKLIVLTIPPLTVAGFLWVAREVHGRIPPTALFALPFVYGHPFMFGFVNFALSMALAYLAFGLWLHLARLGRTRLRAVLFVPISLIVFFCHTYGWGALGLLCFSAEAVRQHDRGIGWFRAGTRAALSASVMALPVIITLVWRSGAHGGSTSDWFDWNAKWGWVKMALRDRWRWFDLTSLCIVGGVFVLAVAGRPLTFSRNLLFTAFVLLACFLLLPRIVFGSAYADMRLVPYVIATAVLAIRFRGQPDRGLARAFAVLGLLFCIVRFGATSWSLARASDNQQAKLAALDHVPIGARVATVTGFPCRNSWALTRNSHLGAMVTVRRDGFSNDQWVMEGLNSLELKYRAAGYFSADPSQLARPNNCIDPGHLRINQSLAFLPRAAFDYVWLVDPPDFDPALVSDLHEVWRGDGSILYRTH